MLTDEQVDAILSETKESRIFVKNFTGGGFGNKCYATCCQ